MHFLKNTLFFNKYFYSVYRSPVNTLLHLFKNNYVAAFIGVHTVI